MSVKSLYVGNIPYSATPDSLSTAFAAYSASNVRIIEGRGFAFIDVPDNQMDPAIGSMNGASMDGRTLTVNEARPRENSSGRSGDRSSDNRGGDRSGGGFGGRSNRY